MATLAEPQTRTEDDDAGTAQKAGATAGARVLGFVTDAASEAALRKGLGDIMGAGELDLRRGTARAAIKALHRISAPELLIVDLSGDPRPLTTLGDLSEVVEPSVRVLVIGEQHDLEFYRVLTRQLGVAEYLHKPLLADAVARHFGPAIARRQQAPDAVHGGRVLAITGTRGGVGATTLAANLAWHLSVHLRHHTVLMDADLQRGTAAMLLGADTGPGLSMALQQPERIDELLIERSALPVNDRLHVLAATEELAEAPAYVDGAAGRLIAALRRRYNYTILDAAFSPLPFNRALLELAQQRVLVMNPTLASVRDTLRLLALGGGGGDGGPARRAILVLNRATMPGALPRAHVERMLGMTPEIVIPDLPSVLEQAATLGTPAVAARGPFRTAVIALAASVGLADAPQAERPPPKPRARLLGWRR